MPGNGFYAPAIDGTDVYWLSQQKIRKGSSYRYDALLNRSSLVDGSRVRLMRFHDDDGYYIDDIQAGGGQVMVNLESEGLNDPIQTKVLRMGRDGSNPQVLATGSKPGWEESSVVEGGRARPNDCGTYVHGHSVTSTGSVVLMRTVGERESSACGMKPNFDHLRVTELSLSGSSREIFTEDIELDFSQTLSEGSGTGSGLVGFAGTFGRPLLDPFRTQIKVSGDRAAYVKVSGGPAYVRDLSTGALSGPYGTGLLGGATRNFPTVDPSGRVALTAAALRYKDLSNTRQPPLGWVAHRAGVFTTPMSPTGFAHLSKLRFVEFCGSRLIGGTSSAIVELDPVTMRLKRRLARYPRGNRMWGLSDQCTDSYVYTLGFKSKTVSVVGYPLDQLG